MTEGIATWGDCSLVCAADATCNHWQLEESSQKCTTMVSYDYDEAQSGFVSGNSYCTSQSEYLGWVTCSETDPNAGLSSSQKTTVRSLLTVTDSDLSLSSLAHYSRLAGEEDAVCGGLQGGGLQLLHREHCG